MQSHGQNKAKTLQPYFSLGCQRQEEISRAAAALPTPRAASRCGEQDSFPILTSVDSPSTCSPLPPGQDAQGVSRAQASAAERGKQPGGSPLASCRPPPFRPHSTQGRAQPGRGAVQPVRGWVGRAAPASQRTWC